MSTNTEAENLDLSMFPDPEGMRVYLVDEASFQGKSILEIYNEELEYCRAAQAKAFSREELEQITQRRTDSPRGK